MTAWPFIADAGEVNKEEGILLRKFIVIKLLHENYNIQREQGFSHVSSVLKHKKSTKCHLHDIHDEWSNSQGDIVNTLKRKHAKAVNTQVLQQISTKADGRTSLLPP